MVSKQSDCYTSQIGRAQFVILKRCYPGGYRAVVRYQCHACGLPPLTDRAEKDTQVHRRKAAQLHGDATVWDCASVKKASDKNLKTKANRAD